MKEFLLSANGFKGNLFSANIYFLEKVEDTYFIVLSEARISCNNMLQTVYFVQTDR